MYTEVIIVLMLVKESLCTTPSCDQKDYLDISKGVLLSNGNIEFNDEIFTAKDYFFDEITGLEKSCRCVKKLCVRKCCPPGKGFVRKQCVNVTSPFDLTVWDEYRMIPNANASRIFDFKYGTQKCSHPKEFKFLVGSAFSDYHIRMDGKLYLQKTTPKLLWINFTPDKYCVDTFVYTDDTGKQTTKLDALVCLTEDPPRDATIHIYSCVCMLISCVFILATVAVYAWLPELRKLHGRVLIAYLLCLFGGYIFLITLKILIILREVTENMCVILSFLFYFFFLSSCFWLNVMSFDIWWTFSGKRGHLVAQPKINTRFGAYALYAFSIPTVLTTIMASLEFSGLETHPLLPNIRRYCFFKKNSRLLYVYGPMVILCLANIIFFVLTVRKIAQIKQQTSVLKSNESTTHNQPRKNQQRLCLYIKLFIVMGINWLFEVISSLYPAAIWNFTTAYNSFIGLIIFIVLVCKPKLFRLMKKRFVRAPPGTRPEEELKILGRTDRSSRPQEI